MRKLTRNEWIAVAVAIVFVGYMFFGGEIMGFLAGADSGANPQTANTMDANNSQNAAQVKTEDLVVGTGPVITTGMQVSVNYILKLADGTLIQDSKQVSGGQPFTFVTGSGQLIQGWEQGILGMRVGGTRIITIPPELGYGSQAQGPIPANSTLVFQIEVVSAQPAVQ